MRYLYSNKEMHTLYEIQISCNITSNPLLKSAFTYYEYTNWMNNNSKFTLKEYNRYKKNKKIIQ